MPYPRFDHITDPNKRAYAEMLYEEAGTPSSFPFDWEDYNPTQDYTQEDDPITTTEEPSTYFQEYGGLQDELEDVDTEGYNAQLDYLRSAKQRYTKSINEDIKSYKPYEQKTYQRSLDRAQQSFGARNILGSGIQKENVGEFQKERKFERESTLRGYQQRREAGTAQFDKQEADIQRAQKRSRISNRMQRLQFTNTAQGAASGAVSTYPGN